MHHKPHKHQWRIRGEHHHPRKRKYAGDESRTRIVLVGNPNVGKSVIFGYLTGRYVIVSNYPGTTVEVSRGRLMGAYHHNRHGKGQHSFTRRRRWNRDRWRPPAKDSTGISGFHKHHHRDWEVIDTPGINNLIPTSEDEVVTRNILMDNTPTQILQVADAKNLRRGLLLSIQLAEMGLPYTLCLNMIDEAREQGIIVDSKALSNALGVPVVETIATQKVGLEELRRLTLNSSSSSNGQTPQLFVSYPERIRKAVDQILSLLPDLEEAGRSNPGKSAPQTAISSKSVALMLLAGDPGITAWVESMIDSEAAAAIKAIVDQTQRTFARSLNVEITQARLQAASRILNQVFQKKTTPITSLVQWLSRAAIHPVGGFVILAAVLTGMYYFVGVFGAGTLVDWLETGLFGNYIVPGLTSLVDFVVPWQLIRDLLVGEYGLLSMALSYSIAIVLPIVSTFFIAFGILEDSGYLPRLSIMSNRVFRAMGLNGKAVLPMVLGLGCGTMATMTTRILDSRKERIIVTLLLALGIPCSAQLGVIMAMLGGLSLGAAGIWLVVVIGVLFLVGYLSSRILSGQISDFLLEVPPLRKPMLGNILVKTLGRLEWYLKEAVPLFFLGTFLLFMMDRLAILGWIENAVRPIIQTFLGLPKEATAAFIMGFLRRDYGAAGLFLLARNGQLDGIQILVSLVVITLFMPCIATFLMIIKERGWRVGLGMAAFILPFALLVGGIVNWTLRLINLYQL